MPSTNENNKSTQAYFVLRSCLQNVLMKEPYHSMKDLLKERLFATQREGIHFIHLESES